MPRVALAFLWHHHQPLYKDPLGSGYAMPWARLHSTRDYPGMALLLGEFSGVRANFNLVPSLLDQVEDCAAGKAVDPSLAIARKRARDLTPAEKRHVLAHAFSAPRATAIDPRPRYRELHRKRHAGRASLERAAERFTDEDLLDLETWWNLAWFHPLLVEEDAFLRELLAKGRGFTEAEKDLLLERQALAAARVIPLYAALEASGRAELTTTPYYHPILPLLVDPLSLHEAMPGSPLPKESEPLVADAREQVRRAIASHERRFGRRPRGMWPAEGSVSEAAARLFAEEGVEWIASDEGVLARSLGVSLARDGEGRCPRPDLLYRPYRAADGRIGIVFRDHTLSDLIGFEYQRRGAAEAVDDFVRRLRAIRDGSRAETALVPVILDGENCWEHYPSQGVEFLRRLYGALEGERDIETVLLSEELATRPPDAAIERLAAGSWIGANFKIWMGHAEDRAAWDALYRTRRLVHRRLETKLGVAEDAARLALEEILIAEGSDWCWWFGDENSSGFEDEWDALFRSHLSNACAAAGIEAPEFLRVPIRRDRSPARATEPSGRVDLRLDGRAAFFEWRDAGLFSAERAGGAVARAEPSRVREIRYAFSRGGERLCLRVDGREGPASLLEPPRDFVIAFAAPLAARIVVSRDPARGAAASDGRVLAAAGRTIEIDLPLVAIGSPLPGDDVRFRIDLREGGRVVESVPAHEDLSLRLDPSRDAARPLWP